MFQSLSGKKVVIIGTSSGLDLAIAEKMVEVGAKVVLSHSSQEKLNEAIALISGEIQGKTVDVSNEDSVNAFFEQIGNFDHLIVTAMGDRNMPRSLLAEMTTQTAQGAMEKFWGTFFAVRASLKNLATDGSITLTSSVSIFKSSKLGGICDRSRKWCSFSVWAIAGVRNCTDSGQRNCPRTDRRYKYLEQSKRVGTLRPNKVG
jgi:NAD(P)-dependent dehydrogenase (short-subunit alcohol dehydrogenase family)